MTSAILKEEPQMKTKSKTFRIISPQFGITCVVIQRMLVYCMRIWITIYHGRCKIT